MFKKEVENVQSILPPDRISNLPNNVAETILMYLPTRDAVRTGILSRAWRHVWTRLPEFVLDIALFEKVPKEHSPRFTLMKILYHLLACHDGPIKSFTLSDRELVICPEIDNLIFFLSRNHLEDFSLHLWKDCYVLPNSFFSCQNLMHLSIRSCSIRTPPTFKGFGMLITLRMIEVTILAETLASLISGSPLLCVLELSVASDIVIPIDALNLRTFRFAGKSNPIIFNRVPVLTSVSIETFEEVECNIEKFFQSSLESLELNYNVAKFEDFTDSNPEETTTYMEGEDYSDLWLSQLKEVKLECVTGTKPELEFTKLLLAKSPSLKKIQIQLLENVDNGFEILKEVARFPRLSKDAELIFA